MIFPISPPLLRRAPGFYPSISHAALDFSDRPKFPLLRSAAAPAEQPVHPLHPLKAKISRRPPFFSGNSSPSPPSQSRKPAAPSAALRPSPSAPAFSQRLSLPKTAKDRGSPHRGTPASVLPFSDPSTVTASRASRLRAARRRNRPSGRNRSSSRRRTSRAFCRAAAHTPRAPQAPRRAPRPGPSPRLPQAIRSQKDPLLIHSHLLFYPGGSALISRAPRFRAVWILYTGARAGRSALRRAPPRRSRRGRSPAPCRARRTG